MSTAASPRSQQAGLTQTRKLCFLTKMGLTFWLLTEVWEPGRFFTHFGLLSFSLRHTITHTDTWTQRPTLYTQTHPPSTHRLAHTGTNAERRTKAQSHAYANTRSNVSQTHRFTHMVSRLRSAQTYKLTPTQKCHTRVPTQALLQPQPGRDTPLQPRSFSYSKWGSLCPAFQEIHSYASLRKKSSSPILSWVLSS